MQQIHVLTCSVRRIKNQALYLKELQKGEWEGDDIALNRSITRDIDLSRQRDRAGTSE